jgi:hypothetical protein
MFCKYKKPQINYCVESSFKPYGCKNDGFYKICMYFTRKTALVISSILHLLIQCQKMHEIFDVFTAVESQGQKFTAIKVGRSPK